MPHEEDLEGRLEIVFGQRDDVDVLRRGQHHLLQFERAPRGEELIAELRRLLELLALRRHAHLGLETAEHRSSVACQELRHRVHGGSIGRRRGAGRLGNARPRTPSDVVVEARPLRPRSLVEERVRARPHGEDSCQGVEGVPDRPGVAVRTEIPDALALPASQDLRPRPCLAHREGKVGIGLVVPIPDVEPGLVLLDQVVLEHQRVDLGRGDDPFDGRGVLHHGGGPRMEGLAPVGGQALPQRRRLPGVDHPPVGVAEQVGAGGVRDRGGGRSGGGHTRDANAGVCDRREATWRPSGRRRCPSSSSDGSRSGRNRCRRPAASRRSWSCLPRPDRR